MSRFWLGRLALVGTMPIAVLPAMADDGPSAATIESARQSVVQVLADDCEGDARAGSGFLYGERSTVISALHVVAGCSRIKIFFEHHGFERDARVVRVLPARDLVMIEVEDSPELAPLERTPDEPESTQRLQAIGYGDSPTMENLEVTVSGGAKRLVDLLPRRSRLEVERSTKVDVQAPIMRFNRPLLPGFSGGPIIDGKGRVAAVSAGGLRSGTVPVSFGWPARFIDELEASEAGEADLASASPTAFFSAKRETESSIDDGVRCGAVTLRRGATMSLEEIALTSSEQTLITWLVAAASIENQELNRITFDLWMDDASGATIPLPGDITLTSEPNWCVARAATGAFRMLIHGQSGLPIELDLSDSNETVQASNEFDRLLDAELTNLVGPYVVEVDTALTDLVANQRADGLVMAHQAGYAVPLDEGTPPAYFYMTHMARNGSYFGVAALNERIDVAALQICPLIPDAPECEVFKRANMVWTPMIFGASMATYPIQ